MARTNQTVRRAVIVERANAMLAHLAESGTHDDQIRREAIIAATESILLAGNSYKGFSYLNPPVVVNGEKEYDRTRVAYY